MEKVCTLSADLLHFMPRPSPLLRRTFLHSTHRSSHLMYTLLHSWHKSFPCRAQTFSPHALTSFHAVRADISHTMPHRRNAEGLGILLRRPNRTQGAFSTAQKDRAASPHSSCARAISPQSALHEQNPPFCSPNCPKSSHHEQNPLFCSPNCPQSSHHEQNPPFYSPDTPQLAHHECNIPQQNGEG